MAKIQTHIIRTMTFVLELFFTQYKGYNWYYVEDNRLLTLRYLNCVEDNRHACFDGFTIIFKYIVWTVEVMAKALFARKNCGYFTIMTMIQLRQCDAAPLC